MLKLSLTHIFAVAVAVSLALSGFFWPALFVLFLSGCLLVFLARPNTAHVSDSDLDAHTTVSASDHTEAHKLFHDELVPLLDICNDDLENVLTTQRSAIDVLSSSFDDTHRLIGQQAECIRSLINEV